MKVTDLQTPALLIDLDIMESNLARMAEYAKAHHLRLRPHTKTHKIPALGKRQLELGAAGLTVAKVSEAEVMAGSGTPDLLIAYPVLGAAKLARLMSVAKDRQVTVSLDSEAAARELSDAAVAAGRTIQVLAEIDVGLNRVGVTPGPDLLYLALVIDRLPGLQFRGVAFYPGHIKQMDETGAAAMRRLSGTVQPAVDMLTKAGLNVEIVSGGSTPTMFHSHEVAGMNEIRPGTYVFNDWNTVLSGACTLDQCAARIRVTIVSTARPGQVIIDGGSKTFSSDRPSSGDDVTFGQLEELPSARFHKMNEEHGFIDVSKGGGDFRIGEQVHIVPNHICVAMNLHETVYGVRNGEVEQVWKVEGRGKLQ